MTHMKSGADLPKQFLTNLRIRSIGLQTRVSLPSALFAWESTMTDPKNHKDASFRYTVHAISSGYNTFPFFSEEVKREIALSKAKTINLLETPHKIAKIPFICCSLIDQQHARTFTLGGFILRFPVENIINTSPADIGSPMLRRRLTTKQIYAQRSIPELQTPDYILQKSIPNRHNQITITGRGHTNKLTEIIGVFIKACKDGEEKDPEFAERLRIVASKNGWPAIVIKDKDMAKDFFRI